MKHGVTHSGLVKFESLLEAPLQTAEKLSQGVSASDRHGIFILLVLLHKKLILYDSFYMTVEPFQDKRVQLRWQNHSHAPYEGSLLYREMLSAQQIG